MIASLFLQLLFSGCASKHIRSPRSDHFDGSKHFNPSGTADHGLGGVIKWKLEFNGAKWPTWIDNKRYDGPAKAVAAGEVSLTFINHASFLLQTPSHNILYDPVFSDRTSPVQWAGPKRVRNVGLKYEDLPPIHYVLISHNHYDHLDLDFLRRLSRDQKSTVFLVPIGDRQLLEDQGITNVHEFDWWQSFTVGADMEFTFAECQHFSGRGLFDSNRSLWGAWAVKMPAGYIYFGGDTGYGPHFEKTFKLLGPPMLAMLPIGAYAPRWFMKEMHINPEEAIMAHRDLKARQSIGMHFGTFQLTDEAIDDPTKELARLTKEQPDVDFQVMEFGETRKFTF